jgi:hypothetical protein
MQITFKFKIFYYIIYIMKTFNKQEYYRNYRRLNISKLQKYQRDYYRKNRNTNKIYRKREIVKFSKIYKPVSVSFD